MSTSTGYGTETVLLQDGSINPSDSDRDSHGRRKLLMIYIHGFMGDESSFRNFPAHVHSLLTVLLSDTHVVYSKIYPRYRSKQHITRARDDFSAWIHPHESAETDVILLGHSMGGLVAAEVVLMPDDAQNLKHRILGTIDFDVPFLGMHPGVISSGLASIFMPGGEAPADKYITAEERSEAGNQDTFWTPPQEDGTFNARFNNDVVLPARKFWQSVQHFVHKHGSDLSTATSKLVSSHIEFMSAMSNAKELKSRYTKLRLLEEDNEGIRKSAVPPGTSAPRVRFVNYYTVSSGRPKEVKQAEDESLSGEDKVKSEEAAANMMETSTSLNLPANTPTESSSSAADSKSIKENVDKIKPKKDRKFCNLPPKDSNGERDPTWVRIFMKDVDEVGAHCGMFFVDERYERLVGDVAERVEIWLNEDMSVRLAHIEPPPRYEYPAEKTG